MLPYHCLVIETAKRCIFLQYNDRYRFSNRQTQNAETIANKRLRSKSEPKKDGGQGGIRTRHVTLLILDICFFLRLVWR